MLFLMTCKNQEKFSINGKEMLMRLENFRLEVV